jgi:NADH dehydrogenase FAD-containing subunit
VAGFGLAIDTPANGSFDGDPEKRMKFRESGSNDRLCCLPRRRLRYDTVIVAAGSGPQYFGPGWQEAAPPLKSIADAEEIRRRILLPTKPARLQKRRTA